MNVFKIAWDGWRYTVSIPEYNGGDVVDYETAKALADELAAEREKVRKLLETNADALLVIAQLLQTLTKPNETKRLN